MPWVARGVGVGLVRSRRSPSLSTPIEVLHYCHTLLSDPNGDLVQQLTRIADSLSKARPSPWLEWATTLSSFVAGIGTAFLSIELQARLGDARERRKMRRIVYVELTNSYHSLYEMFVNVDSLHARPWKPNSKGEIHPPGVQLINPGFTFDGQKYMRDNGSVCYELPEREELMRMYEDLGRLAPGSEASIGDLQVPLVHFGVMYKRSKVIQDNFRRFSGESRKSIEAVANRFADHQIPIEDLVNLVPRNREQS